MTSLSILIPTQGRATLERAIASCIDAGLRQGDELVIVGDTLDQSDGQPVSESVTRMALRVFRASGFEFLEPWVYLPFNAGHHCYGHCQLNAALPWAKGDYILCQDDDDIYAAGAFDRVRAQIDVLSEPSPLLFRFRSFFGMTFWDVKGKAIENHIGGHCAVFPNDERLGRFTCRYQGDFDYIRSTLDNWGGDDRAVWVDDVIAIARPAEVTA